MDPRNNDDIADLLADDMKQKQNEQATSEVD